MNEYIKELLLKVVPMEGEDGDLFPSLYTEKQIEEFAELIVRECANHCDLLLDHKMSSEWSRGTHDCSKAIKKHFGVKE